MRFTEYSRTDVYGHEAYKDPRPGSYIPPKTGPKGRKIMAAYLARITHPLYFLIGVKLKPSR